MPKWIRGHATLASGVSVNETLMQIAKRRARSTRHPQDGQSVISANTLMAPWRLPQSPLGRSPLRLQIRFKSDAYEVVGTLLTLRRYIRLSQYRQMRQKRIGANNGDLLGNSMQFDGALDERSHRCLTALSTKTNNEPLN